MRVNINGLEMEAEIAVRMEDSLMEGRESRAVTVRLGYAEALDLFKDDVPWEVIHEAEQEDGSVLVTTTDMSGFCIAGPVTDHRDGRVTVRMGRPRDEELMAIPLGAIPATRTEAVALRGVLEGAVQSIQKDADALTARSLYPEWAGLVGLQATVGMRFRYDGGLYRVISQHTFATNWLPGEGTESLYVRIDETHAGTLQDPIPYIGNMALEAGLHYTQGGVTYLCNRDTVAPVYNDLSALVGIYVEVV